MIIFPKPLCSAMQVGGPKKQRARLLQLVRSPSGSQASLLVKQRRVAGEMEAQRRRSLPDTQFPLPKSGRGWPWVTSAPKETTTLRSTRAEWCASSQMIVTGPRVQETSTNGCAAPSAGANARNRRSPHKSHPGLEHTEWHRTSRTSIHASCFRSRGVSPLCLADCSIRGRIQARQAEACRFPGQTKFQPGRVSGGSPSLATTQATILGHQRAAARQESIWESSIAAGQAETGCRRDGSSEKAFAPRHPVPPPKIWEGLAVGHICAQRPGKPSGKSLANEPPETQPAGCSVAAGVTARRRKKKGAL